MNWYQVVKTINGRRYLYWQRTYRVGKAVKTLSRYMGPLQPASGQARQSSPVRADQARRLNPSTYSSTAPTLPEDVLGMHFQPMSPDERKPQNIRELKGKRKTILQNVEYFDAGAFSQVQDELDYAVALKTNKEKICEARRRTKGLKSCQSIPRAGTAKKVVGLRPLTYAGREAVRAMSR